MKKRWVFLLICAVLLVCVTGLCLYAQVSYLQSMEDAQENAYVLEASIMPAADLLTSQDAVEYTVSNNSYVPVEFREVLILSAYDAFGKPFLLDGTSYTASSIEITTADGLHPQKLLSAHQMVYASEYVLEKGKRSGKELFDPSWSSQSVREAVYELQTTSDCDTKDCILRIDVILLGRPQEFPHANWEILDQYSGLIQEGSNPETAAAIIAEPIKYPNPQNTCGYTWELYGGKALLVNAQEVQEPYLVVPATISLSQTEDGCVEDPIFGDLYDVVVAGNAFYAHSKLKKVTFTDGVGIERDAMCATNGQGMFQNCSALTTVENIPDTVVSMKNTFSGCTALERTPQIPDSVEDMTQCFWRCSGLTEALPIPESAINLDSCFRECTSLTAIPQLPDGVQNLTRCFYKCASLQEIGTIPDSVTDMTGCFSFCDGVTAIESFPSALERLNFCFQGCTGLTDVAELPEGITDLTGCFYNCVSLTKIPQLPDSVSSMENTFYGCTGLTEIREWPASLKNLNGCFSGCVNLQTVPMIPSSIMKPAFFPHRLHDTFSGCTSLKSVQIETCNNMVSAEEISDQAKVSFTLQHQTSGVCESCQIANGTFKANDLTIRVTNLESYVLDAIIEFLENEIPECLMDTCSSMTFTPDFSQFAYPLSEAGGIAWSNTGSVYIRLQEDYSYIVDAWDLKTEEQLLGTATEWIDELASTVYHELGHCYDYNYSSYHRFSGSTEWMRLVKQEGEFFISQLRESILYTPSDYPEECFAKAVSKYYRNPEDLKGKCPGMYAYVDAILGDKDS